MRSHPPTLLTLARRTIAEEKLWARGDVVLVAVSGGPDSMALLHVLALLRPKIGHRLVAHGVDHGLRAEAAAELDLAARLAESLDVPFARTRVRVAAGGNLQARAREARYTALRDAAASTRAACIATAHHEDDRAETVLLRLLRGAGPAGLAILPPKAGDLVRPLLRARRADIDAHLVRHEIPFARDPSNDDPRYLRTRVRNELLPLLVELSPQIVRHLAALADQLGDADSDPLAGLSRATREALLKMAREKNGRARISVGPNLVARLDRTHLNVVVDGEVPALPRTSRSQPISPSSSKNRPR